MLDKTCINCNQKTDNPKFCSRSCSAQYTNKQRGKDSYRQPEGSCRTCGVGIITRKTWCDACQPATKKKTLGEYRERTSVQGKHPSWVHSHVRQFCRSWNKDLITKPCANCGYDKHVELCHIKAVSSFPDSALLEEVNHPDNVIQLCRNCHWEFDNGILNLSN